MSDIDPDKLKVAELRDELKARGIDTKGNKAALVARLKEALSSAAAEQEEEEEEEEEEEIQDEVQDEEPAEEETLEPDEGFQQKEDETIEEGEPAQVEGGNEAEAMEEDQEDSKEQEAPDEQEQPSGQEVEQTEPNGDCEEEETVVLGDEFQTIDEASQDDTEEGDTDRKRKRSRSPRDRHRHSRSRDRYRRSHSRERRHGRHSPPPRKVEMDDMTWESLTTFALDRYNADLSLRIDDKKQKARPLSGDGFAYMWSGVRSMYGVQAGKFAYEVKVVENLHVDHSARDEENPHILRVGWSVESTGLSLGEEALSFGYEGTGKSSTECKFEDYGQKFGAGDVITAYVDLDSDPVVFSFSKNGEDLGTCFEVEKEKLEEKALFPHLMTKNTEFECNFGAQEEPWFALKEGFAFLEEVEAEDRVRGRAPPATKEECEVILMVGLPGSGKTTWANKHASENADKNYFILGTNNMVDKMKIMGEPRKKKASGQWKMLIDKANKCLSRIIEIAARKKRNYIIDQTNVYASARRRKMQPFEGFQRKAVVVLPADEEFKNRVKQRTEEDEGKDIPKSAVLEMKANFTLPEEGQCFESIEYAEEKPEKEEREKLIEQYRKEGRDALPPPDKRFRRDNRYSGSRDYRGERRGGGYGGYRGGFDRDRRGGGGGGGYRGGRGFNSSWRPYNDRRGGYRGNYRDERRRDDRRDSGGYKGRGGWGGGSAWNSGWDGRGGNYNTGWGSSGGYNQGGGGGYGWSGHGSGSWGGSSGGGYGHSGWGSYYK